MKDPNTFSRVEEAERIIAQLVEKYPELLWAVQPNLIRVMGIDNRERTDKTVAKKPVYAKCRAVKGSEKAVFDDEGIKIRFIIELYWSDWNRWSYKLQQAVLLSQLLEITPEEGCKYRPDCVGFKVLLNSLGVNWDRQFETIPDLLNEEVDFDLDLRPGLEQNGEDSEDEE